MKNKRRFDDENIAEASNEKGVYYLFSILDEKIYIGSTNVSIRIRLQAHKRGDHGECTQNAYYFDDRYSYDPEGDERRELAEYVKQHEKSPRCNDVIP